MISQESAYRHCEQVTWTTARNFAYAIRLLTPPKRRAVAALFAMARRIDDVADGDLPTDAKLAALGDLHTSIDGLQSGTPSDTDPVLAALAYAADAYPIKLPILHEIVEGCERDVRGETYMTMADTVHYCSLVGGAPVRLAIGVSGIKTLRRPPQVPDAAGNLVEESPEVLANDFGVALQLTNILRDISEDLDQGRIYLPQEDRERFGIVPGQWAPPEQVAEFVHYVAGQALHYYERGLTLLDYLDHRSGSTVRAAAGIYRRVLNRILADPTAPLTQRVSLPSWEKGLVAVRSICGLSP